MSVKRTALGFIATVMLAAGLALVGSPAANAEDTRPCVSKAEYYGIKSGQTQATLEARWEVANVASADGQGVNRYFVSYPLCEGIGTVTIGYQYHNHLWQSALAAIPERHDHGHRG